MITALLNEGTGNFRRILRTSTKFFSRLVFLCFFLTQYAVSDNLKKRIAIKNLENSYQD
jgi:hypothetical protein